jgi:hypothetical protein
MLNPFTKTSREKSLAAEILKLRSRSAELTKEIAEADATARVKQAAVTELHIQRADVGAIERATEAHMKAELDVKNRNSALATLEALIADKEAELGALRDAEARKRTVEELEVRKRHFDDANNILLAALVKYADAARELGLVIYEARSLHNFATKLHANEMPVAAELVASRVSDYVRMVQAGSAPASLPSVEPPAPPKPVVKPPEVTRVFAMKPLRWNDPSNPGFTRCHPAFLPVDLPPHLAAEAIANNLAVHIGDPRVAKVTRAHAPKHSAPELCAWIGEHEDEPDEKPETERLLHSAFE